MSTRRGTLLLVPNTLDLRCETLDIQQVLPLGVLRRAAALHHWVAEDARSTRRFLKRVHAVVPLASALQDIDIRELPRPHKGCGTTLRPGDVQALLAPALAGHELGLISEAGLPAVADPGAALVAAAHAAQLAVVPLAGASALTLALAASGLNGQSFAFVGYLPQDSSGRAERIRGLEALSRRLAQTQLFIETPYRNSALLGALLETLREDTQLSVSCGVTLPDGWTRTARIAQWRARSPSMPQRLPAVFALLAA